jgi:hypothetical protein
MDRLKVQAMLDWPVPRPARAVRGFLGLAGYYYRFIRDFGAIVALLTALLKKEGFRCNEDAARVFKELQRALTTAPILQLQILTGISSSSVMLPALDLGQCYTRARVWWRSTAI